MYRLLLLAQLVALFFSIGNAALPDFPTSEDEAEVDLKGLLPECSWRPAQMNGIKSLMKYGANALIKYLEKNDRKVEWNSMLRLDLAEYCPENKKFYLEFTPCKLGKRNRILKMKNNHKCVAIVKRTFVNKCVTDLYVVEAHCFQNGKNYFGILDHERQATTYAETIGNARKELKSLFNHCNWTEVDDNVKQLINSSAGSVVAQHMGNRRIRVSWNTIFSLEASATCPGKGIFFEFRPGVTQSDGSIARVGADNKCVVLSRRDYKDETFVGLYVYHAECFWNGINYLRLNFEFGGLSHLSKR